MAFLHVLCYIQDCICAFRAMRGFFFERGKGMKKEKQFGSVYEFEGRVPLRRALPLGIQHVLAMFLANISPLMIVCGLLED